MDVQGLSESELGNEIRVFQVIDVSHSVNYVFLCIQDIVEVAPDAAAGLGPRLALTGIVTSPFARARAAATQRLPGQITRIDPVLGSLLHAMDRLHADRHLDLGRDAVPPDLAFAGEEQDLQEMLGNLLDNACRSARTTVTVRVAREGSRLSITVDDDGPGIAPEHRVRVLQRGVRLDEAGPGSGLGLAIVADLARLYGGDLTLGSADLGGLRAALVLPAAD